MNIKMLNFCIACVVLFAFQINITQVEKKKTGEKIKVSLQKRIPLIWTKVRS